MSAINGKGYGVSHNWMDLGTEQSPFPHNRSTLFRCKDCLMTFRHYYHIEPDIFKTIKDRNIPDICAFSPDNQGAGV